ncbi:ABC transporter ATP-binding protein [Dethiosulfovibrio salsuginis]|uniref:Amino acid/amide ABC transporter ATP-binding protein 1, HAAT family n=1 Tax=Dethiosulfovibrio salsuginis TaxID=561720 RepID=A0A1X7IMQ1_9BACT|nr:ABC transporter ATP-binding protein [Dethiosulfovibrio salsuginis]SMG15995.1 amino acid/amide ABC transporter ATP-binding protein 1, HAAT family [Dethiosulfovibrio salsuginis]
MTEVLVLDTLNKFFGGVHAVRDVSFTLQKGELAGLIGPNGAGKTTVFNLITGVYPLDSGHVSMEGQDVTGIRTCDAVGKGIARTFQNLRLFKGSSVLENVMTAGQRYHPYSFFEAATHMGRWRSTEKAIRKESMDLLERVGLAKDADRVADTLPYGHQRRLEIARALALRPRLLLLDEPAAGMNPEEVQELNVLIKNIHRDFDLTILVIEHHMELVMEICPHVICLNFGAVIADGTPEDIQGNKEVLKAYLGEEVE